MQIICGTIFYIIRGPGSAGYPLIDAEGIFEYKNLNEYALSLGVFPCAPSLTAVSSLLGLIQIPVVPQHCKEMDQYSRKFSRLIAVDLYTTLCDPCTKKTWYVCVGPTNYPRCPHDFESRTSL